MRTAIVESLDYEYERANDKVDLTIPVTITIRIPVTIGLIATIIIHLLKIFENPFWWILSIFWNDLQLFPNKAPLWSVCEVVEDGLVFLNH